MEYFHLYILLFQLGAACSSPTCDSSSAGNYQSYVNWVNWSAWSNMGGCSRTCGGGVQTRSRVCQYMCTGWAQLWNGYCFNRVTDSSVTDSVTQPCNQYCLNGGDFVNGVCQCKSGMKGTCCEVAPVCSSHCQNGGKCILDETCQCKTGFYGKHCELGQQFAEQMKPQLHTYIPLDKTFQLLSWYDVPAFSEQNRACFIKINTANAPEDTIITAESISTADVRSPLGNYSMGPIDAHGIPNGTSRFACLQVRCPGFLTTGAAFDIVVNVTMETTSGHCLARSQSALLRSGNIISRSTGDDSFRITLENGDNYGPKFGVYIGTGFRDRAVYQAQHSCYSGSHFDHVTMVAENGAIASYQC